MKKELGFIDRVVCWCMHLIAGVELDRTPVHQEQASPQAADC
jgi:hypothetical protein